MEINLSSSSQAEGAPPAIRYSAPLQTLSLMSQKCPAHPGQRETWRRVLFEGQREKKGHLCGHTAKSVYSQRASEAHRTGAKLKEMLQRVLLLQSSQTSVGITGTSTDGAELCWGSPLLGNRVQLSPPKQISTEQLPPGGRRVRYRAAMG